MRAKRVKVVDLFLYYAFDPTFEFQGVEWADTPSKVERLQQRATGSELPARFEPPLVRLRCLTCHSAWDAWVEDDGTLCDGRDRFCRQTSECTGVEIAE